MKLTKTTGLLLLAAGLVAVSAREAAAQAPVLSVSANGTIVTIQWTAVPGATGYNILAGTAAGLSNIATVNLPATTTTIVVNAPAGTYFLRVRGTVGGVLGPFSNEVAVTVGGTPGPGPCGGPPTPPTVTTAVTGGTVTVSWNAVPGATGYTLLFSRFSGGTELVVNVAGTQTSSSQYVGIVGTFFVRVAVLTPCGNATSTEVSFTITGTSGPGPRTPDPAPGTILPKPSYGQDVVIQMAQQYGGDLQNSCTSRGGNHVFMYRVVNALRQRDSRWGMNQKRGNQGLSEDIATYNPTGFPDAQAQQIYLWDIIANHCPISGSSSWNWTDVTAATWSAGQAGGCSNPWCALWYIPREYFQLGFQ